MQDLRRLRIIIFSIVINCVCSHVIADIACMTWNMKWFPSSRRNLRLSESEELKRIKEAGSVISSSFNEIKVESENIIVCAQEVRDALICSNIVASCGIKGLKVSSVSNFKDKTGIPLWQQTAIFSTLPIVEAGYSHWQPSEIVELPRGFSYAVFELKENQMIVCFSLHLKSNLNFAGTELVHQENILKREMSAKQILDEVKRFRKKYGDNLRVLVAGDFNTSEDDCSYVSEATLRSFYGAHYRSCFTGIKKDRRITCPGNDRYEDATFDYILYKGFGKRKDIKIFNGLGISDHNPVALLLSIE